MANEAVDKINDNVMNMLATKEPLQRWDEWKFDWNF